jgi:uncharacterized protein
VILLDTNVLVYAVGTPHLLRDSCRAIVQAVGDGHLEAGTTVEVVTEFLHVYAKRRPRTEAKSVASWYIELLGPPVQPGPQDLAAAIDLFARTPGLGSFDSLLAAVALQQRAEAVVTADTSFADVPGLRAEDPRSDWVRVRLG